MNNKLDKLIGYDGLFNEISEIINNKKLPSRMLLSGEKGIGKSIFAHHLINLILSSNEAYPYDKINKKIHLKNKTYNLIKNGIHPNFNLISKAQEKNYIEIDQVRNLNKFINKSSFNNNLKIVLIDDVEFLSPSASHSLLKIIEEPNTNVQFILIFDSSKYLLDTIKSRCINFKFTLNEDNVKDIINLYFNENVYDKINQDFKNNYLTPNNLINLIIFCKDMKIDLEEVNIDFLIKYFIKNNIYKNKSSFKSDIKSFIELFLFKKASIIRNFNIFNEINLLNKKFRDIGKYNLDVEAFFLEFELRFFNEK